MKRIVCFFFISLLLTSLGLNSSTNAAPQKAWPKSVSIASGTGSTYFAIAGGLGKIMERYLHVPGIPSKTSGTSETARLMARGDLQMGFITPDTGYECYRGIGMFKESGPMPIRAFLQDFSLEFEAITLKKSGIKTYPDLKGKVVNSRLRGSATTWTLFEATLHAYGMKESDFKASLEWTSMDECMDALITGKVDAIYVAGHSPWAKLTELASLHDIHILSIDDAHIAKILEKLPWASVLTIPGGTYKGVDKDLKTIGSSVFIACHKDLPDDFIYEVVKAVFTHFDEFGTYHPVCKLFSPEAVKRVNVTAYHPGAIKYYKEIGVWTKELDKRQAKLLSEIGAKR
jgi:TRAP transporter TAXI family solute receptor